MKPDRLIPFALLFAAFGLVSTCTLMFVQDVRTSNECWESELSWLRTENRFSIHPVAVCADPIKIRLDESTASEEHSP